VESVRRNSLLPEGEFKVWMSHGDRIETLPPGFDILAKSGNSPTAAMGDPERSYFGVQFHPEVRHTPGGTDILRRFVVGVCGAKTEWTPESIISQSVRRVQEQVGAGRVLSAVSGGVDSSVAAALVHRAIGDQLASIFVDNGLLRQGEALQVLEVFRQTLSSELISVELPGPGNHLPGCGRIPCTRPCSGGAHQDAPQRRWSARGYALRAGGAAALFI
jgi:GMP synthase (glutamine-hydrolysing)